MNTINLAVTIIYGMPDWNFPLQSGYNFLDRIHLVSFNKYRLEIPTLLYRQRERFASWRLLLPLANSPDTWDLSIIAICHSKIRKLSVIFESVVRVQISRVDVIFFIFHAGFMMNHLCFGFKNCIGKKWDWPGWKLWFYLQMKRSGRRF